jgi:PAS domain S-box-containing protein
VKDNPLPDSRGGAADPGPHAGTQVLAEHAPVGVFQTDADGNWIYANPACLEIFGLAADEALGQGWLRGVHPDDRDHVVRQCLEQAPAGGFRLEHRVLRPDGSVRSVVARKWRLSGDRPGHAGSVTDISASVELQAQLRSTLQLLDRTGQIAGVGGWDIDLRTRAVRWSTQTYRIYQRPLDWQPAIEDGMHYYAPEAQPVIAERVDRAITHGEPFDVELPFITATGLHLRVRAVGDVEREGDQPVRLFGALQDVTAQHEAASALRASQERLRQLYDETPALMASVSPQGVVLSASNLLLERLGLAREAVVGAPAVALLPGTEAEREAQLTRVRQRLRAEGPLRAVPLRLQHRDGSIVHTLMSAVADREPDGRGVRMLAVLEDISESIRRQAELARERALREEVERQAQELARLADERREMLDVIAHEVRRPLNQASAALQSAAVPSDPVHDADALQRLARAQRVIGDVVAQIDNTLAAAAFLVGNRPLERSDTDIDTLLQLVVADFAATERSRIELERHTATRTASMDLSLMRLALRNLLANALRHAPAGTPVTVRVADSDEPLALLLDVVDRGPGVPVWLRERLFERGVRGPGSHGQGLGLYIAQRALQLHGGSAELLPVGRGETAFRLVVPQGV